MLELGRLMKLYQILESIALWIIAFLVIVPKHPQALQIPQAQPALWHYHVKMLILVFPASDLFYVFHLLLNQWNSLCCTWQNFILWTDECQMGFWWTWLFIQLMCLLSCNIQDMMQRIVIKQVPEPTYIMSYHRWGMVLEWKRWILAFHILIFWVPVLVPSFSMITYYFILSSFLAYIWIMKCWKLAFRWCSTQI